VTKNGKNWCLRNLLIVYEHLSRNAMSCLFNIGGGIFGCNVNHVHAKIVVIQLQMISFSFLHSSILSQDTADRVEKGAVDPLVRGTAWVNAKW
jgi:hypothetical protein